ncbi:Uncharacterised protein [Yersinia mollaretii]|nr:Uncharacterised protein [Yersinia mollaretii]
MNNTIKYLLICLVASTPLFANACLLAGEDIVDCEKFCETQEDYSGCMLGTTQPPSQGGQTTVPVVTEQTVHQTL